MALFYSVLQELYVIVYAWENFFKQILAEINRIYYKKLDFLCAIWISAVGCKINLIEAFVICKNENM